MQREIVGGCIHFLEFHHADALFLRYRRRDKRIVRDHFHSERLCPPGDFHADSSQTDDAHGLAAEFGALERFFLPLSGMHQFIRPANMPGHRQH
jgi:hypothetical protein